MTGRRRLGLVAAAATLLAAAPLTAIFESWTWIAECVLAVALIEGAAVATRTFRFPTWAQAASMTLALLLALTWIFPSGKEIIIPQPDTFAHFAELIRQAGEDTRAFGVPVPDRDGLLFVAVLGVGAVTIVVDLLTAVFRRPALAGLPMLAIYSIPVAVYTDSVPAIPFVIGAAGFMWLLVADNVDRVRRFGRRFTGDGRDVDVWEPSPLAAAGRRIGVAGMLVAVVLPLAVPTVEGGLLTQLTQSGAGTGTGTGNGTGGRINLFASLSGQLNHTTTIPLLKVTTDEPEPFYLRFAIADVLSDNGFGNESPRGGGLGLGLPDPRRQAGTRLSTFTEHHARVEITKDLQQNMAPLYTYATGVNNLKGSWAYDPNQQVLYSGRTTTRDQQYDITYLRARYTADELRQAPPLASNDALKAYTATPGDATVQTEVARLINGKTTDYDKVRAIYNWFSKENGFRYSLATQTTGKASEIADFLTSKTGYCQQYAAAMAWMVRAAGVPARVAFGFTRGTPAGDGVYTITNRNAHAWTEVYFQGYGWVPFDATPAAGVTGSARSASNWAPDVDRPTPTASTSTGPGAVAPDSSGDPGAANGPDKSGVGEEQGGTTGQATETTDWTGLWIAAGVALVLALLLVPALRRVLVRRRRHSATTPAAPVVLSAEGITDLTVTGETGQAREDAHAAWDELIDSMIDFQVPVDPTETPRVTAQRLVRDLSLAGEPAEAATLLGTAEERARYARQPLQGAELTSALRRIRSGMSGSSSRRIRLRATLLPPSVLLSWRQGMAEWSTRVAEGLTGLRESLTRFNPRRLLTRTR
jgi:transglutaminase-like putative cysteine protease